MKDFALIEARGTEDIDYRPEGNRWFFRDGDQMEKGKRQIKD